LRSGIEFIESGYNSGGTVLVHCREGKSRSASFVIGFIMKYKKLSYDDAYALVKSARSLVEPNTGFITCLRMWERMGCSFEGESDAHQEYKQRCNSK